MKPGNSYIETRTCNYENRFFDNFKWKYLLNVTSRCAKKQQRTYRRKFTHRIARSLSPVQTTGKFPCVRYGHPDRVYVEKRCGSCFMYSTVVGRHIVRHWRVLQEKTNSRINNVIYDPRWHPFRGERDKIGGDRGKEAKNPDENPNKLPRSDRLGIYFLIRFQARCCIFKRNFTFFHLLIATFFFILYAKV